jgi:hypothetical protein
MVIGVQECCSYMLVTSRNFSEGQILLTQRLFLEDEEDGVQKLHIFGKIVQLFI